MAGNVDLIVSDFRPAKFASRHYLATSSGVKVIARSPRTNQRVREMPILAGEPATKLILLFWCHSACKILQAE